MRSNKVSNTNLSKLSLDLRLSKCMPPCNQSEGLSKLLANVYEAVVGMMLSSLSSFPFFLLFFLCYFFIFVFLFGQRGVKLLFSSLHSLSSHDFLHCLFLYFLFLIKKIGAIFLDKGLGVASEFICKHVLGEPEFSKKILTQFVPPPEYGII